MDSVTVVKAKCLSLWSPVLGRLCPERQDYSRSSQPWETTCQDTRSLLRSLLRSRCNSISLSLFPLIRGIIKVTFIWNFHNFVGQRWPDPAMTPTNWQPNSIHQIYQTANHQSYQSDNQPAMPSQCARQSLHAMPKDMHMPEHKCIKTLMQKAT